MRRFVEWFNQRQLSEHTILLGFAVIIGVLSALGVVGFYRAIDLSYLVFYRSTAGILSTIGALLYRPLITGAGLFVAWWIMRRLGQGHDGVNVPDVQIAVAKRGGVVPSRVAVARTLASAVTIGSGASAGSEGPVVVLGAAIGSGLGRVFQFTAERVRVFVACGCGAAISAAFNAPLAGAFFALEEILGSLGVASFSPVVVASVVAAVVSRAAFGNHPAFPMPTQYGYESALEVLVFFPLLGVVTAMFAVGFVRTYFAADRAFGALKRRLPPGIVPWIAGIIVGALVWVSGGLLVGYGHLAIHLEMFGRLPWYTLLALGAGGIVATSITLNGGGSGGVFTPSLYVGAATGGGFGVLLARLFPSLGLHPEAYAVVGMGAMIAGATDAPITGILLVFEMTNDYAIVLPLMLTVVIAHFAARRFEPDSLYSGWLRRRGESVEHDVESLFVRDIYDPAPTVIQESESLGDALAHLNNRTQSVFPVVDAEHHVVGVITIGDLGRLATTAGALGSLVLAADIAQETETVGPNESLRSAMRRMGVRGAAAIPVVQAERLIGLISRAHILGAYT
ncbi:MAG TPA: chloride channel protein [Gemmatimonadaceae bacterium]|nr:chloride channel protein [Gemmatimonadaceae bacterium]